MYEHALLFMIHPIKICCSHNIPSYSLARLKTLERTVKTWVNSLYLRSAHLRTASVVLCSLKTNSQFKQSSKLCFLVLARPMHSSATRTWHYEASSKFLTYYLFNLVVTVSRAGRFTITNQPCSDALQDNNSPESAELSSIVVSGVSDITAFRCVLNQTIHMHRRVLFAWCLLLIYLYRWLIQIESQCQSTASVNSANADCQAANVTFTCGSLHVAYELLLRLLENQDVSGIYICPRLRGL